MQKLVTIYGGSGFVGRYIARRLAADGWRIRVAVRRPNEALFLRSYGYVGQVEPVLCNIRDNASVKAAMAGAEAVVNCVGILNRDGANTFDAVQVEGAERIARLATEGGVARLVHISALGAGVGDSDYARTKAEGEARVLAAFPNATILRPSIIFGNEDMFFNRFAAMSRLGPILPLVGAETRFQPVYVDDVAQAAAMGVTGAAKPGIYELGGPEADTLRNIMKKMLGEIHRRRAILNMPFWLAGIVGGTLDFGQTVTGGLLANNTLTRDQVRSLRHDNVVSGETMTFDDLGITPVHFEAVLPDYLWRYRPSGQYDAIKSSARNLRKTS
ncbi:complex I NDUFA9 subunit family protein [Haematobacter massiliensis]|uniref:3-beta hydroxysteroid dehydrogenase n=1 Tax=Haematobacter massiliensis TaxID=195105 RepID=A0A086YAJ6_9RHOB|nr:complex I NDUFA9 subunit family protein [Haematobacter massiliensis]KFI31296.1 3-beta hydroxysteroid dehydrogenase [Haematobacter massiliensis]OWJ73610.1 complex I NDUFA9 subunit family protein [Haematobacter massiliensis]OWJ87034.1 complex I NDUFA9 subunit family protein [Haematobacter massiliensis]QBJ23368.1 complex I NDUFA9 subunit family protein [Haematobacter massiliensis]